MTNSNQTGWGNPQPYRTRSKFHYFGEDGRSLCGRWAQFLTETEEGQDDHRDNCAACKKRKAKLNEERKETS